MVFFVELVGQIVVGHSTDGRVGPNVFCCFDHVDDGVDRQDNPHNANGRTDGGHEGQGEEVAAHGDTGIADGSEDGYEKPGDHFTESQFHATVLHEEQGCYQDKGSAAVHVDGRTDRQDEAGYLRVDFKVPFSRSQGDRQCAGRALSEEGYGYGWGHLAEDVERVHAAGCQEERNNDKELDQVASQDDEGVFADCSDDNAGFNLGRQLSCKGENAYRQDPQECGMSVKRTSCSP